MIGLIYQHYKHFDQLLDCIENLKEKIKSPEKYIVSLVVDQMLSAAQAKALTSRLVGCQFKVVMSMQPNAGLTKARNRSLHQLISHCEESRIKLEQIVFCFTTAKWLADLNDELYEELCTNKGLCCYRFSNDDWLFSRNFSLDGVGIINFSEFLALNNKPDYLMVEAFDRVQFDEEYPQERYNPEDVAWHKASGGIVDMREKILAHNWFNEDGMTNSTFECMRDVENANSKGFFHRAQYFLDLFVNQNFPLSQRALKDFLSTIVSNKSYTIPFKRYEGTILYPLILQRISDWALNNKRDNQFKLISE